MLWPFGQDKKRRKKTEKEKEISIQILILRNSKKYFLEPKQSRKDEKKSVFKESSFCHSCLSLQLCIRLQPLATFCSFHISSLIAHFLVFIPTKLTPIFQFLNTTPISKFSNRCLLNYPSIKKAIHGIKLTQYSAMTHCPQESSTMFHFTL